MPHGGWYGYVGSLTRPVTHRSETEGAAMPLRGLYGFIGALTRPVTCRSETVGVAEGVVRLSIEPALPSTDDSYCCNCVQIMAIRFCAVCYVH